jgi:hypothetical protein
MVYGTDSGEYDRFMGYLQNQPKKPVQPWKLTFGIEAMLRRSSVLVNFPPEKSS